MFSRIENYVPGLHPAEKTTILQGCTAMHLPCSADKGELAMPINIQDELPAAKILESENIFVMTHERAVRQDIRPLKIIILNLMPTKIET